jgi:hypothetical protein
MDKDLRNILILAGVVALIVATFLGSCSVQNHNCRVEAIKAGMKGDEVTKACHL